MTAHGASRSGRKGKARRLTNRPGDDKRGARQRPNRTSTVRGIRIGEALGIPRGAPRRFSLQGKAGADGCGGDFGRGLGWQFELELVEEELELDFGLGVPCQLYFAPVGGWAKPRRRRHLSGWKAGKERRRHLRREFLEQAAGF